MAASGIESHLLKSTIRREHAWTGLGEILYYTLAWKTSTTNRPRNPVVALMELRDVHEYVVKPLLRSTPGVAEINAAGGHERQYVVAPRPADLAERGLTVNDVADAVARNAQNTGGGVIQRDGQQFVIRSVARVENEADIGAVAIRFGGGVEPIRMRDVADITVGTAVRTGAATENGEEAMLGTAMMLAGENSRIVARRVAEALPLIQEQLPSGMELRVQYDRSELVDRTVATVRKNLVEGALLVVVVLLLLLGNWRAALIVSLAIPLSFLAALIGMWRGGVSGNLMSLGAIDFGLVIDGAVVMVENVVRRLGLREAALERRLTSAERREEVLAAGRQVARPMFFGVVIITLVYAPILALTGVEGKMFHPMAVTVMLALGGALALSVTLMPVLCSLLLTRLTSHGKTTAGPVDGGETAAPRIAGETEEEHDNAVIRLAKRLYRPSVTWAVGHPWILVGTGVALTVATLVGFRRLGAEFVPKLDEGSYTVMVYRTNSLGLSASLAQQLATEKLILEKVPEVTRVFSRIGTSEVATDPMPPSQADLYIFYKPRSEWRRTNGVPMTKEQLAADIDALVQREQPGQTMVFAQPMAIATGAGAEVQRPLATVVIGGIISSTLLTLMVLPSLYAAFESEDSGRATAAGE